MAPINMRLLAPILLLATAAHLMLALDEAPQEPTSCDTKHVQQHQQQQHQNSSIAHCIDTLTSPIESTREDLAAAAKQQQQQQQQPKLQDGQVVKSKSKKLYKAAGGVEQRKTSSLSSSMLRSFIRTNNMRAYHLDLHSYRAEAKFSGDPAYVQSDNETHQLRCDKHLKEYYNLLRLFSEADPLDEGTPVAALKLADVYGRPPSGLLLGNQFWLGSYEDCTEHQVEMEGARERINSQYCLGLVQFPSWNPSDTKTSIKVGLCLPETCTSWMLNEQPGRLQRVEKMMQFASGGLSSRHFQRLKLQSVYCLPHASSQIRQLTLSAILLIGVLSGFVLLVLYATICDYFNYKLAREKSELVSRKYAAGHTKRQVIIEGFSLFRNLEKFLTINNRPATSGSEGTPTGRLVEAGGQNGTDETQLNFNEQVFSGSITGLKCIGLVWIIAAHTFLVSPITHNNMVSIDKLTKTILADIYLSAHLMVDTFFALSGLLAAYLLFKSGLDKMKLSDWLLASVHRYWRLTPVYLLCYWFTKSLGHLLNSGPLWDFGTAEQSPRYHCEQESWTEALLHLSDFKSPKDHCVPFAWFIANGIKFWLVTPFILVAIHKSARRGYRLALALIVANMVLVAKLAFSSNVDMKSVIEFKPESAENMLNNMDQVYTRPYSRIGAYLVGLLAGHFFHLIESKQIQVRLSKNMKLLLWALFSVTTIVLTFMIKLANGFQLDEAAIPYIFSISSALIRPLWALCSCWLVFALAHGQARWVANILSANLWKILVKLSFCAYLIQGEVIAHLYLAQAHSTPFTYSHMFTRPIVATALTMVASFVALLFVEYPLIGIEELILPVKQRRRKDPMELKQQALGTSETAQTINSEQLAAEKKLIVQADKAPACPREQSLAQIGHTSSDNTGKVKQM